MSEDEFEEVTLNEDQFEEVTLNEAGAEFANDLAELIGITVDKATIDKELALAIALGVVCDHARTIFGDQYLTIMAGMVLRRKNYENPFLRVVTKQ